MKSNNTKFIFKAEIDGIQRRLGAQSQAINVALAALRKFDQPATLDAFQIYVARGFDHLRVDAIEEYEKYISDTKMPKYLQASALQQACASIDPEFLKEMGSVLLGLELPADFGVLELIAGNYIFSESYIASKINEKKRLLSDDEQADLEKFREAIRLLHEIDTNAAVRFSASEVVRSHQPKITDDDEQLASWLKMKQTPA